MPFLELPERPGLSGLKNSEIDELIQLGLAEMERRQACSAKHAAVMLPLRGDLLPALAKLAEREGMTLTDYMANVLRKEVLAWRRHLRLMGVEVPDEL